MALDTDKKNKLSAAQRRVLDFILEFEKKHNYAPTVRDICEGTGLKSTSTAHGHLNRLQNKGYIKRDLSKPRTIEVTKLHGGVPRTPIVQVPIVGRVAAGQPILAMENIEGSIGLPIDKLKSEDVYILNVKGESMIEAGILDGDNIVVRRDVAVRNGDIVVALIEEEATVKRFFHEDDHVRLQPENRTMEPILVNHDVSILGKVIAVMRWM